MLTPEQQEAMQALREKRALLPDELPIYSDPRLARQLWSEALAAIDAALAAGRAS